MHTRTASLTIAGTAVPVEPGWQITEDAGWLPSISAQVLVPIAHAPDARRRQSARLTVVDSGVGNSRTEHFELLVRRVEKEHAPGHARLTLESTDIITLAHNDRDEPLGTSWRVPTAIATVRARMDPNGTAPGGVYSMPGLPDWTIPTDGVWPASETAASIVTSWLGAFDFTLDAQRNGRWNIAHREYNATPSDVLTITDDKLLEAVEVTTFEDFANSLVVEWADEHGNTGRRVRGPLTTGPYAVSSIGRRGAYRKFDYLILSQPWLDSVADSLWRAVRSRGGSTQFDALGDLAVRPGSWVRLNSSRYGVDVTQRVDSVVHRGDGQMTVTMSTPIV